MQDIPLNVRNAGLSFEDYFDSKRAAVLDADHCVQLNYEAFFFADAWERERFLANPVLYCGLLTDPLSRQRFRPSLQSPRAVHGRVTYFFESEDNRKLFLAAPERYRLPGWKM